MTEVHLHVTEKDYVANAYNRTKKLRRKALQVFTVALAGVEGYCFRDTEQENEIHLNLQKIAEHHRKGIQADKFVFETLGEHVEYVIEHEALHSAIHPDDIRRANEELDKRRSLDEELTLRKMQKEHYTLGKQRHHLVKTLADLLQKIKEKIR